MNYYGEEFTRGKNLKMHFRICLTKISPKINSIVNYIIAKRKIPHLNNPKTLDEKLMWLKLYYYANDASIKKCADKFEVREYLSQKGYAGLLNKLLFAVDRVDDIPWDTLPDQFAIKWSFGSGFNIICSDKKTFDKAKAIEKLKWWGKIPYWKMYSEMQYKDTHPKIIGEKFLEDKKGGFPIDYKFYCFHGQPQCVMICTERETGTPKFYFFDRDWNLLRLNKWGKIAPKGFTVKKPKCIDEMFHLAEILSRPFPFVRLDLYDNDGEIIFGEFTFAPSGGADPNRLLYTDHYFGGCLDLTKIMKKEERIFR